MNRSILTFDSVAFRYQADGNMVLTNLSLEIPSGSVTSILGPNGVGKTTLLYLALGWLKPHKGKILLADRRLSDYSRRELGQWMGLVPQTEHISFDFTLLEYVLLGRAPYLNLLDMPGEVDIHIASEALIQVGLENLQHRSVLNLSGGERQLLLMARALAQQPRILLLDEPSSHLDLGNKIKRINLIRTLAQQGVTIIFTTHEAELASSVATHLILIKDGSIQETGKLEDVLHTEKLSALYGVPVRVINVDDKRVVVWG